jgi:hypothetical protein
MELPEQNLCNLLQQAVTEYLIRELREKNDLLKLEVEMNKTKKDDFQKNKKEADVIRDQKISDQKEFRDCKDSEEFFNMVSH